MCEDEINHARFDAGCRRIKEQGGFGLVPFGKDFAEKRRNITGNVMLVLAGIAPGMLDGELIRLDADNFPKLSPQSLCKKSGAAISVDEGLVYGADGSADHIHESACDLIVGLREELA